MRYAPKRYATARYEEQDTIVQNDLAVTPSRMVQLMEQGIPIAAQNLRPENFYDGDTNPGFDIPLDMQRGIDVADCWNASRSIRAKARKGLKADVATYGKEV